MLSDVLDQALIEIGYYQTQYPELYDLFIVEIEIVKSTIDHLRELLDQVPDPPAAAGPGPIGPQKGGR